jgi:hypothetical protein
MNPQWEQNSGRLRKLNVKDPWGQVFCKIRLLTNTEKLDLSNLLYTSLSLLNIKFKFCLLNMLILQKA